MKYWELIPDNLSKAARAASGLPRNRLKFYSRSNDALIRVYDQAGNVAQTHEQAGEFKE